MGEEKMQGYKRSRVRAPKGDAMDFASYRADLMRYRADLEEVEQLRTFLRTMVDNLEQIVRRGLVTENQTVQWSPSTGSPSWSA